MRNLLLILTFDILICCSSAFGLTYQDSTCLSTITDTIKSKYLADKYIVKLNDRLILNGQEYCFLIDFIKSVDIYKNMSLEIPEKIESLVIDLKINQDIDKIKPKFYSLVDTMPEFHGGINMLFDFIYKNFNYPSEIDACCKIYIQFIVDETGNLTDIKIVRSLHILFDNELLRVFSIMPKWKPGLLNGKPVPVKMIIPIDIRLQ